MTQQNITIEMPASIIAALKEVAALIAPAPAADGEIVGMIAELKAEIAALRHEVAQLKEAATPAPVAGVGQICARGEHYATAASIIDMSELSSSLASLYAISAEPKSKTAKLRYDEQLDELHDMYDALHQSGITSEELSYILDILDYKVAHGTRIMLKLPVSFEATPAHL